MADIGDKLRNARKVKGMPIGGVEKVTKIRRRYLATIKNNGLDQSPGDFYVRAFTRQFADVVGLNGKELLADCRSGVPEAKPEEYTENSINNRGKKIREIISSHKRVQRSYLPQIATVIGVILVILVIYAVYTCFSTGTNQQSANQVESVTASSPRIKSSKPKTSSKKKSALKTKTSEAEIVNLGSNGYRVSGTRNDRILTLGATENEVWTQILVSGLSVWQGTLRTDGKHSIQLLQNTNNVSVQMSNSALATLTLAGRRINTRGSTNSASSMTIRFTFIGQNNQSTNTQQNSSTNQSSTSSVNA